MFKPTVFKTSCIMLCLCIVILMLLNQKRTVNGDFVEPLALSNVLAELKDDLGVKRMQTYFDNLKFVHENVDGKRERDQLVNVLRQRFHDTIFAVDQIKTTVEDAYSSQQVSSSPVNPECCKINPTKTDYRFKTEVFNDKFCEIRAQYISKDAKYLSKSLEETMINNMNKNPDLRWQFFGSQDGILSIFPAHKFPSCDTYDNRLRPWYVEGIAPEPKDIVLIIDKSGSMEDNFGKKSLIEIAVSSAESVLNSLNSNDRVGIVAFSDSADTPPGDDSTSTCYSEQLATAIGVNLKYLKKYLKNIKTGGETFYAQALQKAFSLLKTNPSDVNDGLRKKVILFLTDGKPTDKVNITAVLEKEKHSLKLATSKDVVIFAYGIGSHDFSLLREIAEDTEAEGTKGRFTEVTHSDLDQLRLVFSSFYNFFAKTTEHSSHYISAPYFDAAGLGEMVTIFAPCFYQQKVIGVAGTDVVFSDLISDVSLFGGQYSYAFLITRKTGNVIIHPYMPRLQSENNDPVILHITALEQEPEFKQIILESMIRGEEGSRILVSKRYLTVGSGSNSGVEEVEVNSTYYWKPIQGTSLSLCVVLAQDATESGLESLSTSNPDSIVYHLELDLNENKNDDFKKCSLYGLQGTADRAVVKFSGQCFEKPYDYTILEETEKTINAFKNYIKDGRPNPEPKFRPGVREMTLAGLEAELVWDRDISKFENYASFLYYASTNGVIFVKPGLIIDKNYDPTKRLWFQNAVNNKGKLTVTTPYLDAFGSGLLVDIVHPLYEGKSSGRHDATDDVVAVLDASFDIFRFHRLLTEVYPECREKYRCFIMDKSGLIMMHNHFVNFETVSDLETLAQSIGNTHITELERSVAEDMIKRKLLYRKKCKDFQDITNDNFYEVNVTENLQVTKVCPKYQVTPLKGTTAYLGVVDDRCLHTSGRCFCPRTIYNTHLDDECVCPFKSRLEYDYCRNEFPPSKTPLCPVPPQLLSSFDSPASPPEDLKNCFDDDCEGGKGEEDCYSLKSCTWCVYSKSKSARLENPYCINSEQCYGGVQGNSRSVLYPDKQPGREINSTETDGETKETDNNIPVYVLILVPFVGGILIIILVILAVCIRIQASSSMAPENDGTEMNGLCNDVLI